MIPPYNSKDLKKVPLLSKTAEAAEHSVLNRSGQCPSVEDDATDTTTPASLMQFEDEDVLMMPQYMSQQALASEAPKAMLLVPKVRQMSC